MKIIKKGVIPSEYTYEGTCSYCETEIQAKTSEVIANHDQRENKNWYTVGCPICKKRMYVSRILGSKI